jgi:hypothetical protein
MRGTYLFGHAILVSGIRITDRVLVVTVRAVSTRSRRRRLEIACLP